MNSYLVILMTIGSLQSDSFEIKKYSIGDIVELDEYNTLYIDYTDNDYDVFAAEKNQEERVKVKKHVSSPVKNFFYFDFESILINHLEIVYFHIEYRLKRLELIVKVEDLVIYTNANSVKLIFPNYEIVFAYNESHVFKLNGESIDPLSCKFKRMKPIDGRNIYQFEKWEIDEYLEIDHNIKIGYRNSFTYGIDILKKPTIIFCQRRRNFPFEIYIHNWNYRAEFYVDDYYEKNRLFLKFKPLGDVEYEFVIERDNSRPRRG